MKSTNHHRLASRKRGVWKNESLNESFGSHWANKVKTNAYYKNMKVFFELECMSTCCWGLPKPKYEPFITHNRGTLIFIIIVMMPCIVYSIRDFPLKGSYDVAKKNIILCIWCNAMFMWFKVQKTHYFPHTVHHCSSSMPCLSETRRFLQSSSFWEARRALIGQLSSALWLAEYLKLTVLWCRVPPRWHKNNKTHYKRGICCIQWGHNYWL